MLPELSSDESVVDSDMHIAFFDVVGTMSCPWTRSIRESKENCFPDIKIPRIRLLIALKLRINSTDNCNLLRSYLFDENEFSIGILVILYGHLQELSFISLLNSFRDQSSPLSNNAAKLPLTTLGDIGELANNKLAPKLLFQLRVSVMKT